MTETTGAHVTDPVPLSRELVLRTALEIIDQDGVEGLSMRRLGRALGRDPMARYRYAAGKPALLDGVAELILDELTVDTQDDHWPRNYVPWPETLAASP
jgi:AcrR family transcriptional regulator